VPETGDAIARAIAEPNEDQRKPGRRPVELVLDRVVRRRGFAAAGFIGASNFAAHGAGITAAARGLN